eukprot:scaffold5891_cov121-Isochrysis_galbana.AAC.9
MQHDPAQAPPRIAPAHGPACSKIYPLCAPWPTRGLGSHTAPGAPDASLHATARGPKSPHSPRPQSSSLTCRAFARTLLAFSARGSPKPSKKSKTDGSSIGAPSNGTRTCHTGEMAVKMGMGVSDPPAELGRGGRECQLG